MEPAASGEAVAGPGANPAGVPYLRGYGIHEEVFTGGRTYATPDDKWLVDVPAGISIRFTPLVVVEGPAGSHEGFSFTNDADTREWITAVRTRAKFSLVM